jgi:DNA polymerase
VFGEGAAHAPLFIVGEQPGNDEDLAGAPFVGPAGRVLDSALQQAGIDRGQTYVTNVVKHFKFERAGTRRLHKRPGAREIAACAPWIDAELEVVRPRILVCLGATAAQALLGRDFRVTARRGQLVPTAYADTALATIHPSAVLRQQSRQARHRSMLDLVADLRVAAEELARVTGPG